MVNIYYIYECNSQRKKKPVGMDMGRGNCSAWLVGLLIGTAIMENCMDILKEIKKQNYVIYKSFFGAYVQ